MSAQFSALSVRSADDVSQVVREHRAVRVSGGGTKWAAACRGARQTSDAGSPSEEHRECPSESLAESATIDMRSLTGITEYEPDEYTFTAKAGTALKEIAETLGKQGQYLPFDPLFIEEGATLGGTVAAAVNGPGRLRYGGVRDFIVGVRFVDGEGRQLHGGGKVVKNAAGFDFPKLMVGSFGRLGVMTEVTFKVFPKPEARITVAHDAANLQKAVELVCRIARGPFEAEAVELKPPGRAIVRLAGHEAALGPRLEVMQEALGVRFDQPGKAGSSDRSDTSDSSDYWQGTLSWKTTAPGSVRVRAALTPTDVTALDAKLEAAGASRRYSVACNAAFIEWPCEKPLAELDTLLTSLHLGAIALSTDSIWLGKRTGFGFLERVKAALDPQNKFGPLA